MSSNASGDDFALFGVFEGPRSGARPHVVYCGDDAGARKVAAQLISDAGFEPLDVGPLQTARYTEPFALLVARIAYEGERGPAMVYRFEWFEEQ